MAEAVALWWWSRHSEHTNVATSVASARERSGSAAVVGWAQHTQQCSHVARAFGIARLIGDERLPRVLDELAHRPSQLVQGHRHTRKEIVHSPKVLDLRIKQINRPNLIFSISFSFSTGRFFYFVFVFDFLITPYYQQQHHHPHSTLPSFLPRIQSQTSRREDRIGQPLHSKKKKNEQQNRPI